MTNRLLSSAALYLLFGIAACGERDPVTVDPDPIPPVQPIPTAPAVLPALGQGPVAERFASELSVHGGWAYTGTWNGPNRMIGNALKIWDVRGNTPVLVDSIIVEQAITLGDVQVSDNGRLLVVATERSPGSIVIYDLANPAKPRQISRFSNSNTFPGVHTAEVARVNGRLYAFLSVDPSPAQLVIVDLEDAANPREVFAQRMGNPFIHDVFVRDGLLFTALWNGGMTIWDIGGGGRGGSPANPVQISNIRTVGGKVHNIWWLHERGSRRYVFVGEEGPGSGAFGTSSSGDIHVVDVSDLTNPREVAFFTVAGAGTHNFSVDEPNGFLYAAYYNGGVRVLDVRGDLGSCTAEQKAADGRCDLQKMGREVARGLLDRGMPVFVWGVQHVGAHLYASDMLNGLWKLEALRR